jgi:uncharacterized protein (TIRG00374 family)
MPRGFASKRIPLRGYGISLIGLLALGALVVVVLHLGEFERFIALARTARPAWFSVAFVLQGATYVAAAGVWQRALAAAGQRLPLRSLVPLGLAKLFTDQAFPSVGLSGTVLLARGLARRGVHGEVATQVLLASLVSFNASFMTAALVALGLMWLHHEANPMLVAASAVFSAIAIAVPAAALGLKRWGARSPPAWSRKIPGFEALFESVARAPEDLLRNVPLLIQTFSLQASVLVLDALTLWVIFYALGEPVSFLTVFVAFVMASVVATIGLVPLGLGTFEASSVAMLSLLGVEVEVALAATLLLRGLTFWLPMVPGVWLARLELEPGSRPGGAPARRH